MKNYIDTLNEELGTKNEENKLIKKLRMKNTP